MQTFFRTILLFSLTGLVACSESGSADQERVAAASNQTGGTSGGGNTETTADDRQGDDESFSVIYLSDPQLFRSVVEDGYTGMPDTDAEGPEQVQSLVAVECFALGRVRRRNGLCDAVATNDAVVDAVAKIADLQTLPQQWACDSEAEPISNGQIAASQNCLTKGAGSSITDPIFSVVNGDLTDEFYDIPFLGSQVEAFEQIYADSRFDQPLLVGLGNHDYQKVDKNHRKGVEWMSNELPSLDEALEDAGQAGLADHDMQGVIHVRNQSIRRIKFRVKADGIWTGYEVVPPLSTGWKKVRRSGQNVSVQVKEKTSIFDQWQQLDTLAVSDPTTNNCFTATGSSVTENECGLLYEPSIHRSAREGSMAYSYDIGGYHFVQLHWDTNFERSYADIQPTLTQEFEIKSAEEWLIADLQKASKEDRPIVINIHWPGDMSLNNLLKENPGFNVVAVFGGHVHNKLGLSPSSIEIKDANGGLIRSIPRFFSGAGFCGTMLYVDFHESYFNWASVRAWTEGSNGAQYIRPSLREVDGEMFAIGEPMFITDNNWTCHNVPKDGKVVARYGTVDFSLVLANPGGGLPPVAACMNVTVEADDQCSAVASIDAGSYDPEGGQITLSQDPLGPYGPGDNLVALTATKESGASASCEATATVVDTTAPTISCNVPAVAPPDTPLAVTATASDNCSVSDVIVSEPDCYKVNGAGKRVDLNQACRWSTDGDTLTLQKTLGVGTQYDWTATALDASGLETVVDCHLEIQNPGQSD